MGQNAMAAFRFFLTLWGGMLAKVPPWVHATDLEKSLSGNRFLASGDSQLTADTH